MLTEMYKFLLFGKSWKAFFFFFFMQWKPRGYYRQEICVKLSDKLRIFYFFFFIIYLDYIIKRNLRSWHWLSKLWSGRLIFCSRSSREDLERIACNVEKWYKVLSTIRSSRDGGWKERIEVVVEERNFSSMLWSRS